LQNVSDESVALLTGSAHAQAIGVYLTIGANAARAKTSNKSWQITADREVVSKFTSGRKSCFFVADLLWC